MSATRVLPSGERQDSSAVGVNGGRALGQESADACQCGAGSGVEESGALCRSG